MVVSLFSRGFLDYAGGGVIHAVSNVGLTSHSMTEMQLSSKLNVQSWEKWYLSWSSVISLFLLLAGRGHLFVFLVMVE